MLVNHDFGDVRYGFDDTVARVTLQRPESRNAVRRQTVDALQGAFEAAARDGARALVLAADGPAFSAGQDLHEASVLLRSLDQEGLRAHVELFQQLTRTLVRAPFVSIARVHGAAVGLGAELAVACDLRVAAHGASFTFPEARVGMFQTNGVLSMLPRLIGRGQTRRLLLTGARVDGREAAAIGLVEVGCEDGALDAEVDNLVSGVLTAKPEAIAAVRSALGELEQAELDQALRLEVDGVLRAVVR